MPFARGIPIWTVMLAGCMCLPGCGGSSEAPGAPEREEEAAAPGAPIRVPSIGRAGNWQLSELQPELEKQIRDRCGGVRCVGWEIEHVESGDFCTFQRLVPAPGQLVQRGSTLKVISGQDNARPCGVEESVPAQTSTESGPGTGPETGGPPEQSPASPGDSPGPPQERGPDEDGEDERPDEAPGEQPGDERAPEPEQPPAEEPT